MDQWITFNEPIVPVEFGYFYDAHYPHKVDAEAAVKVAYHTQLASSLAVRPVMNSYQIPRLDCFKLTPAYPRSQHPADVRQLALRTFQAQSLKSSVLGTSTEVGRDLAEHESCLMLQGRSWAHS